MQLRTNVKNKDFLENRMLGDVSIVRGRNLEVNGKSEFLYDYEEREKC